MENETTFTATHVPFNKETHVLIESHDINRDELAELLASIGKFVGLGKTLPPEIDGKVVIVELQPQTICIHPDTLRMALISGCRLVRR